MAKVLCFGSLNIDYVYKVDHIVQNEISELAYIVKQAKEKGMIIVLNPPPMNERLIPEILDGVK